MKITKRGKYQTRDGRKVRIYATDVDYVGYSIHGAILTPYGWNTYSWTSDGLAFDKELPHRFDLVPVPKKRKK